METARVSPIPKSDDHSDPRNYHPNYLYSANSLKSISRIC